MSIIDEITIEDFKKEFTRNFPFLPVMVEGKAYFIGEEVYVEPNFYRSLIDANLLPVTDATAWELYKDDINNYVSDNDIQKAWNEAKMVANIGLGLDDEGNKLMFLYLVAFFLAYDLQLANSGAYGVITYPVTSVSVGSVSESYSIPSMYLDDPILAFYTRNGFGLKYLNMVYPYLRGNVRAVFGWTLP